MCLSFTSWFIFVMLHPWAFLCSFLWNSISCIKVKYLYCTFVKAKWIPYAVFLDFLGKLLLSLKFTFDYSTNLQFVHFVSLWCFETFLLLWNYLFMFFIPNHEFHFIEYDNTCIYTCTYTLRSCELFKLMYFLVLPSAFTNSLLILYFWTGKQFYKMSEAGLGGNNLHIKC